MPNLEKKSDKTGLPPESLVYTGKEDIKTKITLIEYNKEAFSDKIIEEIEEIEECPEFRDDSKVKWIKVNGFRDLEILNE